MSYLVFARKWRPQNFDEVIGQEHIATTLKNAISLNRVAHAYIFSGPRGIGKTSTARILAKALNCEKGPIPSPCNKCDSCQEISEGRSLDVIEIDGASNRGIEQVRQLRENVKFAAAKSRFKVYIIDEVHQITTDGFNALLKTLEEPPAHVKFIFATTQGYKVLPTILSRCQRFDFKPLSISSIVEKLKHIIKAEKLEVTDEALIYIARAAQGSMRDAESILDQLSSFCKGKVNLETVTSMLGMIDFEAFWEIAQKIIEQKSTEALSLVEKVINEGKDLGQFIAGLIEHFRHILITKVVKQENFRHLIDLPPDHLARIEQQGKTLGFEEIFYIFNLLLQAQDNVRRALSARVVLEVALVKLTQRGKFSSLEEILNRLAKLEQSLNNPDITIKENSENTPIANDIPLPKASSDEEGNPGWLDLVQAIKEEKMFVASYLEFGQMAGMNNQVLTIAFAEKYNFYKETLEHQDHTKLIEAKAKEIFKRDLRVKFILVKDDSASEEEKKTEETAKGLSDEPIIKSALKIFQGRITKGSLQ